MQGSWSGTVRIVGKDARIFTNDRGTSINARIGFGSFGGFIFADLWISTWTKDDPTTIEAAAAKMKKGTVLSVFGAELGTSKRKNAENQTETDQPSMRVSLRNVDIPAVAPTQELSEDDESPF